MPHRSSPRNTSESGHDELGSVPQSLLQIVAVQDDEQGRSQPPAGFPYRPPGTVSVEGPATTLGLPHGYYDGRGKVSVFVLMARYRIAQLDETPAVDCPCGEARRAFADPGNDLATVHLTDISADSQTHYHKRMTEIYVVLEGEGEIELDGRVFPLRPLTSVMIHPGCRHRARGHLRILNIPIPAFDPADEHFD